MKNLFKISAIISFVALILISCNKEENQVTLNGGTAPVLSAVSSLTVPTVLIKTNSTNTWNTLKWTNPNYIFNTGVSSQDVTYTIQFDTVGSNFKNPNIGEISIANNLQAMPTIGDINKALNVQLKLKENVAYNVEMRIKSTLTNASAPLYSNVLKTNFTPYLDTKVVLPANLPLPNSNNGDLFLVGDATAGGWANPVPTPTQRFTQINAWTYEITVPLVAGKEYLMLPKNGDWGNKYAVADKTVSGLKNGGDFDANKNDNFPGPSESGNYKITVDFKLGTFLVKKL